MKLINIANVKKQKSGAPLFTGDATLQTIVTDTDGSDLTLINVHFPKGVRNKFHTHSNDQVLIVTEGKGFVATRNEKIKVKKGDIVWAPAGEEHSHGADDGSALTHISVTKAKTKLEQIED